MPSQAIPVPLGTFAWSANGRAQVDLTILPPQIAGRIAHLQRLTFEVQVQPTVSSGSPTQDNLQKVVRNIRVTDGVREHFNGSFQSMRLFEALERGQLFAPECDAPTTGQAMSFNRALTMGFPTAQDPSDYYMPTVCFRGGLIDISFGAAADVTNGTAITATVTPVAWVVLQDDVRIPPCVERRELLVGNGAPIPGEAIYAFLGLCKSNAFPAIATGDIGNIATLCGPLVTAQVHAAVLERAYHEAQQVGQFSQVHGEPRAATDANPKTPNITAIQAAPSEIAPVLWSEKLFRISKLLWYANPEIHFSWSGAQTTLYALCSRIIPRDEAMTAKYVALIKAGLGIDLKNPRIDTNSKQKYFGPRAKFMPIKGKAA